MAWKVETLELVYGHDLFLKLYGLSLWANSVGKLECTERTVAPVYWHEDVLICFVLLHIGETNTSGISLCTIV